MPAVLRSVLGSRLVYEKLTYIFCYIYMNYQIKISYFCRKFAENVS